MQLLDMRHCEEEADGFNSVPVLLHPPWEDCLQLWFFNKLVAF